MKALILASFAVTLVAAADPGRPVVKNGTLYAANGAKMRGTMRNVYNAPNNSTYVTGDTEYQNAVKYKLNAFRYWIRIVYNGDALNTGEYQSHPMSKQIQLMDAATSQCAKFGLYSRRCSFVKNLDVDLSDGVTRHLVIMRLISPGAVPAVNRS